MYSEDLLQKVELLAKPIYAKVKIWCHGWKHVSNVVKAAKDLAEMEGVDPVLCQIAAYCHDLGRLEEEEKELVNFKPGTPSLHAAMGVAPTKKILEQIGLEGKGAEDIIQAVQIHNVRKYEGDNKIALILQDADRADGYGKQAILRTAVFNCQINIKEPINEDEMDETFKYVTEVLKKDSEKRERMIDTLNYVFGWVDELANTESLKKYVKDEYEFNRKYLEELKSFR